MAHSPPTRFFTPPRISAIERCLFVEPTLVEGAQPFRAVSRGFTFSRTNHQRSVRRDQPYGLLRLREAARMHAIDPPQRAAL